MQDGTSLDTLKVLVVTEDRVLQRQMSQFFDLVGYPLLQASDRQSAQAAVAAGNPQILLIDADPAAAVDWELCRKLSQRSHAAPTFKFLLVDEPDESHLQEALEAGIDDFLVKPISHGELLTRLRAAARVLEYDRRVAQQSRIDPLTGLLSMSAFMAHLRRQSAEQHGAPARVACVVLDIDFFARVPQAGGTPAAEALLQAFARELNQQRSGSEVFGSMGGDRFCVMLPGADEQAAQEWAETAREALAAAAFKVGDAALKLSVSLGVAECETPEAAGELLERAERALATAKRLGRNCVVTWSDHLAHDTASLAPDNLFERTVVRDVMTPCSVFLRPTESVGESLELLDRTKLDCIPVVDNKGKLLGIFEQTNCAEVPEDDQLVQPVRDVMTTDPKTFDASESLATLMEYFHHDSDAWGVVVADGHPVGQVTCNSLVALSRPIDPSRLAPGGEFRDTSDYLLVPDLVTTECEAGE